ncbi:hypothetical protein [Geothrix sp. PMB-07]|uniref:hypothetical protein n=1 Tax=Geothrix sp. PMB-07 TaxID=3068640 RepID=UPI002742500A|nr:hypothetical protein [Geothrix sp. PMB-07]WLT31932.1 hypothetical protein Q9293_01105 [Geothrix sp. PMB-07]
MMKFTQSLLCIVGFAPFALCQQSASARWSQVQFLLGEWRGSIQGDQGKGSVIRRYRLILSGEYLQEQSTYNFPPQALYPNGSVTTQASFFAKDRTGNIRLFRQDDQIYRTGVFTLSKTHSVPAKLVFEMEPPTGVSVTWKVRETIEVISPNAFVEIVETSQDGKTFAIQSRIQYNRSQS